MIENNFLRINRRNLHYPQKIKESQLSYILTEVLFLHLLPTLITILSYFISIISAINGSIRTNLIF